MSENVTLGGLTLLLTVDAVSQIPTVLRFRPAVTPYRRRCLDRGQGSVTARAAGIRRTPRASDIEHRLRYRFERLKGRQEGHEVASRSAQYETRSDGQQCKKLSAPVELKPVQSPGSEPISRNSTVPMVRTKRIGLASTSSQQRHHKHQPDGVGCIFSSSVVRT